MRNVEIKISVDGRETYACLVQEGNAERVARAMKEACRSEIRTLIKESRAGTVSSGKSDTLRTEAEKVEAETTNLPKHDENRVYMLGQASGLRQAANMIDA